MLTVMSVGRARTAGRLASSAPHPSPRLFAISNEPERKLLCLITNLGCYLFNLPAMRGDYLPASAPFNENVCYQHRIIVGLTARVYAFVRFPTFKTAVSP